MIRLLILMLFIAGPAIGVGPEGYEIYRCISKDGSVSYQQNKCYNAKKQKTVVSVSSEERRKENERVQGVYQQFRQDQIEALNRLHARQQGYQFDDSQSRLRSMEDQSRSNAWQQEQKFQEIQRQQRDMEEQMRRQSEQQRLQSEQQRIQREYELMRR